MPFARVNAINLYYDATGLGEAMVLLHGLGSCADDWQLQLQPFAEQFRVITLDLRGHGRSDKPNQPYSIALFASDVAALMDALPIEAAHVVGLSLGGCVAQQLALDFPARVRRLVLVNTFARVDMGGPLNAIALALRMGALSFLGLPAQARIVARRLFPKPEQMQLRQAAEARIAANDPAAYRRSLAAVRAFDVRERLSQIACPTLVIAGDRDTTVPLRAKQLLAARIPNARLEIFADSGHATPVDQPQRFNKSVLEFIKRPAWRAATHFIHAGRKE